MDVEGSFPTLMADPNVNQTVYFGHGVYFGCLLPSMRKWQLKHPLNHVVNKSPQVKCQFIHRHAVLLAFTFSASKSAELAMPYVNTLEIAALLKWLGHTAATKIVRTSVMAFRWDFDFVGFILSHSQSTGKQNWYFGCTLPKTKNAIDFMFTPFKNEL